MKVYEKMHLLPDFPTSLLATVIRDVNDGSLFVWKQPEAIDFIEYAVSKQYAIMKVEVFIRENGELFSIGDEWTMFTQDESWEEYVQISKREASNYINQYAKIAGNDWYHMLTFSDEQELSIRRLLPAGFPDALLSAARPVHTAVAWPYNDVL